MNIGFAKDRRGPWLMLLGIILLVVACALSFFWISLNGRFTLPTHTGLMIKTSPKAALMLPEAERKLLPLVWQRALEGDSAWPVVLGAYENQYQWQYYALVPRWRVNGQAVREKHGLIALVADQALSHGNTFRFLSYMDWSHGHWSAPASFWFDPIYLFPNALTQDATASSGFVDGKKIRTTLPLRRYDTQTVLEKGDVSLQFDPTPEMASYALALIEQLGLDALPFRMSEIHPTGLRIQYDEAFSFDEMTIAVEQGINPEQARQLWGGWGFGTRTETALPDGTLVQDRLMPTDAQESALYTTKIASFGTVSIERNKIRVSKGEESASQTVQNPHGCEALRAQAYVSGKMLTRLLIPGSTSSSLMLPGAVIGSFGEKLGICFE